jgi:hypothetical protein
LRLAAVATVVCHAVIGAAAADTAGAAARKPTHIAAQDLGPALKQFAQSRKLQVLYLSSTVRDVRTRGANGNITANEAFDQLLDGTGLSYRYLDENTVTIEESAAARAPPGGTIGADTRAQRAQSRESGQSPPLQEIIVTGSEHQPHPGHLGAVHPGVRQNRYYRYHQPAAADIHQ